ncbi:MAG: DNA mismatch repair endonuclease MutL [Phycisphaerae bacterium]|nr:DNA mismatch repair endonuclease MutL [Phycisphaerae bacterium]
MTSLASPRIRLLPPLVACQIAAGEVVERPASVVKELIENALDARATRVVVELEQGGIELVRVSDDGRGMPAEDLPLALAAHATSKIASVADLDRIGTLGFRGEALASIASVSRLSIRSRAGEGAGEVSSEGGMVGEVRPASGPGGTSVTVRNLFFNTPARRKFLRTPATEQDRCVDAVRALAMSHPLVGFRATVDGRAVIDLPADQTPHDRALAVLGAELKDQLVEVHADRYDDARGLTLWGLAGLPSIARASARVQHVFVNGRAVRDRTIQHAIAEAYRGLIEPGRYATVVVMIEMSPEGVDVNVHPQKAEVRFRDSGLVHSTVLGALRRALHQADLTPRVGHLRPGVRPGSPVEVLPPPDPAAAGRAATAFVDFFTGNVPRQSGGRFDYDAIRSAVEGGEAPAAPEPTLPAPAPSHLQVHNSYVITQDEQGVVIIDQHALHERVMFEYLVARIAQSPLESQRLLTPALIDLEPAVLARLPEIEPILGRIGVEAQPMGPRTLGVHAFPTFLFDRGVEPDEFVRDLLAKAEGGELGGGEDALREVLDMMACKAAVKAGDHLSGPELSELVKLRESVERSSNCPHGRPTSVRLTIRELERLFGRA